MVEAQDFGWKEFGIHSEGRIRSGNDDEKNKIEELKAEFKPLTKLVKEVVVGKVEQDEQVEKTEKVEKVEESQKVQKVERDENVTNEKVGMMKTPQIHWDFRQSEVRDELNDGKTTEIPNEIEENWLS